MLSLHPHQDRVRWTILSAGAAVVAAFAVRNAINITWRVALDKDPPNNPADSDTSWRDALLWTTCMGLAAGVARLLANRGMAAGWQAHYGQKPPGFD